MIMSEKKGSLSSFKYIDGHFCIVSMLRSNIVQKMVKGATKKDLERIFS